MRRRIKYSLIVWSQAITRKNLINYQYENVCCLYTKRCKGIFRISLPDELFNFSTEISTCPMPTYVRIYICIHRFLFLFRSVAKTVACTPPPYFSNYVARIILAKFQLKRPRAKFAQCKNINLPEYPPNIHCYAFCRNATN